MLRYNKLSVTEENVDSIKACLPPDLAKEIKVGETISCWDQPADDRQSDRNYVILSHCGQEEEIGQRGGLDEAVIYSKGKAERGWYYEEKGAIVLSDYETPAIAWRAILAGTGEEIWV